MKAARKKTGMDCGMMVINTNILSLKITAIASDFDFVGGSIGAAEGEAFLYGIQHAIENDQPFVVFTSGGGMRMMESLISLSQMTRTTLAINELKKNNLPYIVVLTDPTAGGITASYAMLGDLHLAEPGALIAFAGARVIQGTVREELPVGLSKKRVCGKNWLCRFDRREKRLKRKDWFIIINIVKEKFCYKFIRK